MRKKEKTSYTIIKLPMDLADEIDRLMYKFGYRTRSEFVKDAVRRLLRVYEQTLREREVTVPERE